MKYMVSHSEYISVLCEIITVNRFLRVKETETTKNKKKKRSNGMKLKLTSDVLSNDDISALKCPWALSDCESKVWYRLVATALLPRTLKTKKSQSHNSYWAAPTVISHVNEQKLLKFSHQGNRENYLKRRNADLWTCAKSVGKIS